MTESTNKPNHDQLADIIFNSVKGTAYPNNQIDLINKSTKQACRPVPPTTSFNELFIIPAVILPFIIIIY